MEWGVVVLVAAEAAGARSKQVAEGAWGERPVGAAGPKRRSRRHQTRSSAALAAPAFEASAAGAHPSRRAVAAERRWCLAAEQRRCYAAEAEAWEAEGRSSTGQRGPEAGPPSWAAVVPEAAVEVADPASSWALALEWELSLAPGASGGFGCSFPAATDRRSLWSAEKAELCQLGDRADRRAAWAMALCPGAADAWSASPCRQTRRSCRVGT